MLEDYLVKELGFSQETLKTLVFKYPAILSKTKEEMEHTFASLRKFSIGKKDTIEILLETPTLLSVDLEK